MVIMVLVVSTEDCGSSRFGSNPNYHPLDYFVPFYFYIYYKIIKYKMSRKKHSYHYIYKTTNLINNKFYIGMHSTSNLDDGYLGSGKRLRYSIRKHGIENFKKEILEFLPNRILLVEKEIKIVNSDLIIDELCMNLKVGGSGGFSVEQQKINVKKSIIKQKLLKETDKEWVEKRYKNMSNAQKKLFECGKKEKKHFFDWTDRKHTEESKMKIGYKNSMYQKGEKNSQFNTCWVYNSILKENKKIKNDELDKFVSNGWVKGRKMKF